MNENEKAKTRGVAVMNRAQFLKLFGGAAAGLAVSTAFGFTPKAFAEGGGELVAQRLTQSVGAEVPLLGQVPLDPALREGGDAGTPLVLSAPESAAGKSLRDIAGKLAVRKRGLAGMSLSIDTTRNL